MLHSNTKGFVLAEAILVVALVVGIISIFLIGKDDEPLEEMSETIIEKQLGLPEGSVDLTPNSPE